MSNSIKFFGFLILASAALCSFKSADIAPDPVLSIMGKTTADTHISVSDLRSAAGIEMNEEFVNKGYVLFNYRLVYVEGESLVEITDGGSNFSEEIKEAFSSFEVGQKFSIEKITIKAPTGMEIKMPSFSLEVN